MMSKSTPKRSDLDALLKKALEAFNSMTLEEQEASLQEQAVSFVYGQMINCAPEITRAQVREVINRLRNYSTMKTVITAVTSLLLVAVPASADDKPPHVVSITLDNCAKVTTEVQKVDISRGTVWLQSVTCTGDNSDPKVREPGIGFMTDSPVSTQSGSTFWHSDSTWATPCTTTLPSGAR